MYEFILPHAQTVVSIALLKKELIRATSGAELCATYANLNPNAGDCTRAYDETYQGRVNLSRNVRVGEPVQQSALHWIVPYDVSDAAGNVANTVWRDVKIEEVDLADIESKLQKEATHDRKTEIQVAVDKALAESERRKREEIKLEVRKALEEDRRRRGVMHVGGRDSKACPDCPMCDCSGKLDESTLEAAFANVSAATCSIHKDSYVVLAMLWMENFLPIQMIPIVLFTALLVVVWTTLRWFLAMIFSPASQPMSYIASDERERLLQGSVTVYHSNTPAKPGNGQAPPGLPPTVSFALGGGGNQSIFSPQQSSMGSPGYFNTSSISSNQQQLHSGQRIVTTNMNSSYDDIYASPLDVMTPRRRGEGAYRTAPFATR
jgi:hypothetical protein